MGKDTVRYRTPRNPETERLDSSFVQRPTRAKQEDGYLVKIIKAFSVVLLAIIATLFYAYATSSTSSVAIMDRHDFSQMKWRGKQNSNLQKGQKLYLDLIGPESIVVDDKGGWYTGLLDGWIAKIVNAGTTNAAVVNLTETIQYTAGNERSAKRPLGMRLFMGNLYFADSYQGIFSIDLGAERWEKIVGYDDVNPPLAFANDLTITSDGVIYFTDVSARWEYHQMTYIVAEGECTGRVFRVDIKSKKLRLVRDHLCCPNGIELSADEKKLLISENTRQRISIIDPVSGNIQKQILLHGGADNIRRSRTGGYWVPLPIMANPISNSYFLTHCPFIRDIASKILEGEHIVKLFGNFNQGTIIKLNEEFEIEQVHQDLEGKLSWAISHVEEYLPGKLLLGSFVAGGIVKLDDL